jgi:hypothetical protein
VKKHSAKTNSGPLTYTQQIRRDRAEAAFYARLFHNPPALADMPRELKELDLRETKVTDEEIGFLVDRIPSIDSINLQDCDITNASIAHFTRMTHIGELRLKDCANIDDSCCADLARLKGIRMLHLRGTNITIKGLQDMSALTELRELYLSSMPGELIEEKMQDLRKQIPQCKIVVNGTALD